MSSWRNFYEGVGGFTGSARLFRVLSNRGTWASGLIKGQGISFPENSMDNFRLMMTMHIPDFVQEQTAEALESGRRTKKTHRQTVHETISAYKVNWAINLFALYKSPGLGGIYPVLKRSSSHGGPSYEAIQGMPCN